MSLLKSVSILSLLLIASAGFFVTAKAASLNEDGNLTEKTEEAKEYKARMDELLKALKFYANRINELESVNQSLMDQIRSCRKPNPPGCRYPTGFQEDEYFEMCE